MADIDDKTRIELEAAVYRRLVEHLRKRTDVQNIALMNLAGFCRNCLSNWMMDEGHRDRQRRIARDRLRRALQGLAGEVPEGGERGEARRIRGEPAEGALSRRTFAACERLCALALAFSQSPAVCDDAHR